jgi:hypothetical protein
MVSSASPHVARNAPQASKVPVPAASSCLIGWAIGDGRATVRRPCGVTTLVHAALHPDGMGWLANFPHWARLAM